MAGMIFSKRVRVLAIVGLTLVAISVYAPALAGGFVWDDQALIVENTSIHSWTHVGDILSRDFFHLHDDPQPYGYYRPVITLSYLLEYHLWGLRPFGYHATNVLLHAVSTVLVALILRRLRFGDGLCFTVALLFAVHPIHVENVAWIAGRTDLFAFVLTGAAFLSFPMAAERTGRRNPSLPTARGRDLGGSAILTGLSASAFALGLLAKEMSVVLIPWLALSLRMLHGSSWRRIGIRLSPHLLVLAAYCLLRFWALGIEVPGATGDRQIYFAVLSAAPTTLRYLGWMLLPVDLNAYVQNPYVSTLADVRLLGSLVLLALLGSWLWRFLPRPQERLVLAMLLTSFLPILNLVRVAAPADMGNPMSERFCYFPSFLFLAVLALLVARMFGDKLRSGSSQFVGLGVLVLLMGLGTTQTVLRTRDWRDEYTFVTGTLKQSPTAPLLWDLLALCRLRRMVPTASRAQESAWAQPVKDQAELRAVADAFQEAVRLNPDYLGAQHNLGATLYRLGDLDGAIRAFREAIRIKPAYVKAHINLGAALQDSGDADAAIVEYRTVIKLLERGRRPSSPSSLGDLAAAQYNLGVALLGRGDQDEALVAFGEALRIRPDLFSALVDEALFRARRGDAASASALLGEAVRVQPDNVPVRSQYARVLANLGHLTEANAVIQAGMKHASGPEREALSQALSGIRSLDPPPGRTPRGEDK